MHYVNKYPKISIVILNWLHWHETLKCLHSVLLNDYPIFECIVVDNGSTNNSEQNIIQWLENLKNIKQLGCANKKEAPDNLKKHGRRCCGVYEYYNEKKSPPPVRITILQTGFNFGYSGGNNVGIERALESDCDYVLILNSDTIVKQEFIWEIVKAALDSRASVIGGLIKDSSGQKILSSGESLLKACLSLGLIKPKSHKEQWWQTDCVNGSAMMLSRAILVQRKKQLGYYLIPHLFLYCEEIELGFWCKEQNMISIISGRSEVLHKVGASSEGSDISIPFYYLTRNRLNVAKQYLKGLNLSLFYMSFFLLRFSRASFYFLSGKNEIAHAILLGFFDGLKNVKGPKPA